MGSGGVRGLCALRRNGSLELYFRYWDESKYPDVGERQIAVRNAFISALERIFEIKFDEDQRRKFPNIPLATWRPKLAELEEAILQIAKTPAY